MTPQDLIAALDILAEAPDGLTRLREIVRQLAVRGKLVPQQLDDEPATALVERIAAEKSRLAKAKEIRRPKDLPPVSADEVPFDLPPGWTVCRFDAVHRKLGAGSTPRGGKRAYVEAGFPFLRSQNIWNDGLRLDGVARIPEAIHRKMHKTIVRPNDVLLNITGASIARAAVVPSEFSEANVSQHVAIVRQVDPAMNRWVHLFLTSPHGYACIMSVQVGISREGLSMARLREFVLPVPPLAEQKRIIARVDQLMGLLDTLEAKRTAREATRVALRGAALAALQDADTPEAIEAAWTRIAGRMDDLFIVPGDVEPLRQAVLQLAMRGRLVPQEPTDEPASTLLARIAVDRVRLAKEKKARKPKALPPVSAKEVPFEIPAGWAWGRLADLVLEGPKNGWSPKGVDFDTGVRTLKLSATTKGVFDGRCFKFVEVELETDADLWLKPGDLLIQRSNTPEYVGMAAVFDGPEHTFIYPDLMMRCRLVASVDTAFVHKALIAPFNRAWFSQQASGTSQSMVKVNQETVRSTLVPIPPASEQARILAKLDELVALLDKLVAHLAEKEATHDTFAAAVVHHLDI